jgi:spore coat protein A
MNRREFLRITGATAAILASRSRAYAFYQSPSVNLWARSLRGVGPGGIPVAVTDSTPAPVTGVAHYTLNISQFTDQLHPNLGSTTLWGYQPTNFLGGGAQPQRHLGGIIVAQRGTPIQFTFRNNLPARHPLPVDTTIPGANLAVNRTATHLHGGLVPWISDGGPFTWFDPLGNHGPSFLNNTVLNPGAALNEAEYFYPNSQSARLVWYHDHAIGITRLNAYAGIASAYIIRDTFEGNLRNFGLPNFIELGGREIPIVIQDKIFVGPDLAITDPTYQGFRTPGSLWYQHIYERNRWRIAGNASGGNFHPPDPSVIPEMFGDTMLANGTVYPQVTVEARRYRLRVLNACNARFLNLQLLVDDGSPNGITLNPATGVATNAQGPYFLVLGTEGGFLPHPVSNGILLTGPAERWDALVDFTGFGGRNLILYNDAPAPFPSGDPRNDYFPGFNTRLNPVNASTAPGFGPNTREMLRFNVVAATSADPPLGITTATDLSAGNDPLLNPLGAAVQGGTFTPPPGISIRRLTLNETFDPFGRLIQLLGTNVGPDGPSAGFGRAYEAPPTETPRAGTIEIWEIANLTGDTHPIHFHLVNVQILARQPFKVSPYNGTPAFTGPARLPDANENGWKETVRMNPGEVTWVMMRFTLPSVPFTVPASPRTGGTEYVWHCHILEHEEHDMMRPLVVI